MIDRAGKVVAISRGQVSEKFLRDACRGRLVVVRAVLVLLALLALAPPALAKPANFADVEDEVMCVSCNVALNVAESPQADAERRYIRQLIAKGEDKDQIKAALVRRVRRERARRCRSPRGSTGWPYLVPIALIAALALALAFGCRAGGAAARRTAWAAPPRPELSDADSARLDADLARSTVDPRRLDHRHDGLRRASRSASSRSCRRACCRWCPAICRRCPGSAWRRSAAASAASPSCSSPA